MYYRSHQFNWEMIAKFFSGRSPIMLKNRYYSFIRKNHLLEELLAEVDALRESGRDIEDLPEEEDNQNAIEEFEVVVD